VAKVKQIILATPRFAPDVGGAETWTREVTAGLVARGHRVTVVARGELDGEDEVRGVRVLRFSGGRARFAGAIMRVVGEERPDVVLAQYSALPFAIVAAHRAHIPAFAIVHDAYGWRASVRVKGAARGTLRWLGIEQVLAVARPDGFLVPSRATGHALGRLARRRPVTVVPAGADHIRPGAEHNGDPTQIVFVGRLVPTKGVDDLIAAIGRLRENGRCVHATIVGSGPESARLHALAAPLREGISFVGGLDDATLERTIRRAGMLVLPSTREGWGLVVTEAAARGVPYVAYDIPAVAEQHAILNGGLLIPPSRDALHDAIATLLDDRRRAEDFGAHGRRATASMTWTRAAAAVELAISGVRAHVGTVASA